MKNIIVFISVLVALLSISCGDQYDNIRSFATEEAIYPGGFDTIIARVGFASVELDLMKAGRIPSSEIKLGKATKTVVTWDDQELRYNELRSWVRIEGLDRIKSYTFRAFTEDDHGNRSTPQQITVIPFSEDDVGGVVVPSPIVTHYLDGITVSWPQSLVRNLFLHAGLEFAYRDKDGVEHTGAVSVDNFKLTNVDEGDRVTIELKHFVHPKVYVGEELKPIINLVEVEEQIIVIVPPLIPRANIALDKSVITSSGAGGEYLVDNEKESGGQWISSASAGTHIVEIDLWGAHNVDGITIFGETAIENFEIQAWVFRDIAVSDADPYGEWETLISVAGNTSETYATNFASLQTNRVRVVTEGQSNIRLYEIAVYKTLADPTLTEERTNVALFRDAIANVFDGDGNAGSNAVDGNTTSSNSRWYSSSSGYGSTTFPKILTVSWESHITIDGFRFIIGTTRPVSEFDIHIWDLDRGEWRSVAAETGNALFDNSIDITPVTTTQVRFYVNATDGSTTLRFHELFIFTTEQLRP